MMNWSEIINKICKTTLLDAYSIAHYAEDNAIKAVNKHKEAYIDVSSVIKYRVLAEVKNQKLTMR